MFIKCIKQSRTKKEIKKVTEFFVAIKGVSGSAKLGGLSGADQQCQSLASSVGAGDRTWRAYLSAAATEQSAKVNARDRIGKGPWYNGKGQLIANSLEDLHSEGNNIDRYTWLNEKGTRPKGVPHDVLTGSDKNGYLAMIDGVAATCNNWTHDGDGVMIIGHDDRMYANSYNNKRFRHWNGSWNSEHQTFGCSAKQLSNTGGGGGFYCFAADAVENTNKPEKINHTKYTFKRGVTVNHWLGDNITPDALYGDPFFDQEDVIWIAQEGFDHIRIVVDGHNWVNKVGDIDVNNIVHFDNVLQWADANKIGVVLAMRSFPGYRTGIRGGEEPTNVSSPFSDEETLGDAAYLWWMVEKRYNTIGNLLRYELMDYPSTTTETSEQMQTFNATTLASVCRINNDRVVYLTSRRSRVNNIDDIVLSDPNTAIALSVREPNIFTRQSELVPPISFPGKVPDLKPLLGEENSQLEFSNVELNKQWVSKRIESYVAKIRKFSGNREIYNNFFGAQTTTDSKSVINYTNAMRTAFEKHSIHWSVYDYHTGGTIRAQNGTTGPTSVMKGLAIESNKKQLNLSTK